MVKKEFLHRHRQFADLVAIAAESTGMKIDPFFVEKDYWIMHCLFGLQEDGYEFQLKGAISLSKGFNLIHRFSEDIDLHIEPPQGLNLKTGKNHNTTRQIEARKNYFDDLAKNITIEDINPVRDCPFDDEKCRNGGIRLLYDSCFKPDAETVKEGVLLEVGFANVRPNQPVDISSWAYDYASSVGVGAIDNRAMGVLCYLPGYTLVEKLQTISTKYRKFKRSGEIPNNFMRHYYDVYCLLQNRTILSFAQTDEFESHRVKHFPAADRKIPFQENQAFHLSDPGEFKALKNEYVSKQSLYHRGQPRFEDVMNAISAWAKARNP